ncbi:GNAT family N-acetyltransferase [Marinactinospora thermotolerans]|uniref:[SSU ribosomal protein S5P]-alanine acetyltransferase n=1 Tax=Marinactinospora thermotolerans DSM 45154 TaxID=1122192 RepID=A0A1T4SRJ0_9ACTN|nr:GNAT family protein [Marinactinospora thermotolerans]SKA30855.1 [SSU ribosomal protein S5P]-alanine acetyltransferase [Marinactinospora thermotolerans DSM 45154]
MTFTRLLTPDDAPELAKILTGNRGFLAEWDPLRDDDYFTVERQSTLLEQDARDHEDGTLVPLAILDPDGRIVGRLNIGDIVRGALQSARLGYWVSRSHNGRGLATRAVAEAREIAFGRLGLHRLQAETLIKNTRSQRVLERNGFTTYGIAPQYLLIAGRWQDHILYQLLNPEWSE